MRMNKKKQVVIVLLVLSVMILGNTVSAFAVTASGRGIYNSTVTVTSSVTYESKDDEANNQNIITLSGTGWRSACSYTVYLDVELWYMYDNRGKISHSSYTKGHAVASSQTKTLTPPPKYAMYGGVIYVGGRCYTYVGQTSTSRSCTVCAMTY